MNSNASFDWSPTAPLPLPGEIVEHGRSTRKKLRWAYLRWLLLGSHYLYLRRPFTQLLFWATLGGLLLWWVIDLTRLDHLVRQHNERALQTLVDQYHDLLEFRAAGRMSAAPVPDDSVAAEPLIQAPTRPEASVRVLGFETRPGAILLLTGALAATVALYAFNPPSLYPRADHSTAAE